MAAVKGGAGHALRLTHDRTADFQPKSAQVGPRGAGIIVGGVVRSDGHGRDVGRSCALWAFLGVVAIGNTGFSIQEATPMIVSRRRYACVLYEAVGADLELEAQE